MCPCHAFCLIIDIITCKYQKENLQIIDIYIYIKEIIKKKNKTDFSQHSCTNVFTAVADLQVQ